MTLILKVTSSIFNYLLYLASCFPRPSFDSFKYQNVSLHQNSTLSILRLDVVTGVIQGSHHETCVFVLTVVLKEL